MERNPQLRHLIAGAQLSLDMIDNWRGIIFDEYLFLESFLPDDHLWKKNKLAHAQHCEQEIFELSDLLGLDGVESCLFAFLMFSHDIGRFVEARRKENQEPAPWPHGKDSANVLRRCLDHYIPKESHTQRGEWHCRFLLWRAMLGAIEHHSDRQTPTLKELGGDVVALALAGLLRDMDKRGNLTGGAERFVSDQAFKQLQIKTHFVTERKTDPTWGDEKRAIVPESLLSQFAQRQTLKWPECQSYEAYALQFLAWIFDFNNQDILELTMREGGPRTLMSYLTDQLAADNPQQLQLIRDTLFSFEADLWGDVC